MAACGTDEAAGPPTDVPAPPTYWQDIEPIRGTQDEMCLASLQIVDHLP